MRPPKKFGIWITQKCPMRCSFCPNSDDYFAKGTIMNLDVFRDKVSEVVSSGIASIDLTPIIGEVLTISNLNEYLDYLDSRDEVKEYTFITCLVCPKKHIDFLLNRPKLKLEISLYGTNKERFKQRTNKDAFSTFISNFKYLVCYFKNPNKITIINRTEESLGQLHEQKKTALLEFLLSKCYIDNDWVADRPNYVEERKDDVHRCHFMTEPLLVDGGICFCCMDWNKKFVIRSKINELYTDKSFHKEIVKVSNVCNKQCGWYREMIVEN